MDQEQQVPPEIPPVLSSDLRTLFQPMRQVELGGVLLDDEFIRQASMVEVYVYLKLVVLARSGDGRLATIPPIRQWSSEIGIDYRRVRKAMDWLDKNGWITITNLHGPRDRFRIVIREANMVIGRGLTFHETVMREAKKLVSELIPGQLDIIYNSAPSRGKDTNVVKSRSSQAPRQENSPFSESIIALIEQIPHTDKRGRKLSDYSHLVIHSKAHKASPEDIEAGLLDLYAYEPSAKHGGRIGSILAVWSALFTIDQEGKGVLKKRLSQGELAPAFKDKTLSAREEERAAAVQLLLDRKPIYRGHLDRLTIERAERVGAFEPDPEDDKKTRLRDGYVAYLDDSGGVRIHCRSRVERE